MKKRIVIEVENELQETWLQQMFEREIEDTKGTIANERLCEKGSDGEAAFLHHTNILELIRFKELLEGALHMLTKKGDTK